MNGHVAMCEDIDINRSVTMNESESDNVMEAKEWFDVCLAAYLALLTEPAANVSYALRYVFLPMLKRWNSGERSEDLADKMAAVR